MLISYTEYSRWNVGLTEHCVQEWKQNKFGGHRVKHYVKKRQVIPRATTTPKSILCTHMSVVWCSYYSW